MQEKLSPLLEKSPLSRRLAGLFLSRLALEADQYDHINQARVESLKNRGFQPVGAWGFGPIGDGTARPPVITSEDFLDRDLPHYPYDSAAHKQRAMPWRLLAFLDEKYGRENVATLTAPQELRDDYGYEPPADTDPDRLPIPMVVMVRPRSDYDTPPEITVQEFINRYGLAASGDA